MTQKVAFYIAAFFFAIAAVASFIGENMVMGMLAATFTIICGIMASQSKVKSTL